MIKTALIGLTTLSAVVMPLAFAGPASAVEPTTPTIDWFYVTPETFYPDASWASSLPTEATFNARITDGEDGYPNSSLSWNITVRGATGTTVAERNGSASDVAWEWDGKDLNGSPVPVDTYTATLTATNPATGEVAEATTVVHARAVSTVPEIRKFTASPTTFFPTVRDGYRDGVSFTGWSNEIETRDWPEQSWNITIRNANGVKVAERSGMYPDWDGAHWDWKGKDLNGNPVKVGTYKATFTVTNTMTGEEDTATLTLTATSDTIYRKVERSHTGVQTSSRSRSSHCYIYAWDSNTLALDCWGGNYAIARYGFSVPSKARDIRFAVTSSRDGDGTVRSAGWRTGDHVDVAVKATGYAIAWVDRVSISYKIPVRR